MFSTWRWGLSIIFLWASCVCHTAEGRSSLHKLVDVNPSLDAFTAESLPSDGRYMCSVGNGHLATDVFSTAVYMNGLYNGRKGESHRARIPAVCNVQLADYTEGFTNYTLNTREGVFVVVLEDSEKVVVQRLYAHRFYTRAIVNQFFIQSKTDKMVSVNLLQASGDPSEDIDFDPVTSSVINGVTIHKMCGRTKEVEDERYQPERSPVCVYMNDLLETISGGNKGSLYTFVMTADTTNAVAQTEITKVLSFDGDELYKNHTDSWENHNAIGKTTVEGDPAMSKIINGMWYYLSSSLPTPKSNQPQNKFSGLSPGGLSRGSYLQDYQGHSFWDTEIWMYPVILAFYPNLAERLLEYRISNQIPAKDIAAAYGNKGTRFPWESAFTGGEVTPDCCPEVVDFEQHITACIAFAIRQYFAVTGDVDWLKEKGCDVARNIAEFWASRAEMNSVTGLYDIKDVMGPDEDHPNITNSVFTNVIAGEAMRFGEYASCICSQEVSSEWTSMAQKLTVLYDEELDYNPQFENYVRGTQIKQADVVLLDYPLLYTQNRSTTVNNLEYYESVTRENGPAMTWSIHTIGYLRLDNVDQASRLYTKSYQPYVREPFKIWTEAIEPEIGAVNFITGMGGFLQTFMYGYGGISIYLDRIEILNPRIPPGTTALNINEFKYLGSSISLHITEDSASLEINTPSNGRPLVVEKGDGTIVTVGSGATVTIENNERYKIRPVSGVSSCPTPA